jgi:hypothetical protein
VSAPPQVSAWSTQSVVSQPGPAAAALDGLPPDLAGLRRISHQLVFHYQGDGDWEQHGIDRGRAREIDLRYAAAMLERLLELGGPLGRPRTPDQRILGCCRDFSLLLVTMARHAGIPARVRVGFATYFDPGWFVDHAVAEVWDGTEGRWRLVDAQIPDDFHPADNGSPFAPLDVPPDRFILAPRAWQAARLGDLDPEHVVVNPAISLPALRGWPYLAHNLLLDLAALNKQEMLLWDTWGVMADGTPPDSEVAETLDELAGVTSDPEVDAQHLRAWGERSGLGVTPEVTSFDPLGGPPRRVPVPTVAAAIHA